MPSAVKQLGFFVDRRRFGPWSAVGTITETTSAPYLERLVAALDDFTGQVEDLVIEEVSLGGS